MAAGGASLTQDEQSEAVEQGTDVGQNPHQHGKLHRVWGMGGDDSQLMSHRKQQEAPPTRGLTHLDGVDQVLDQEEAPQLADGLVELGQSQVTVLVHHFLRERHLLVQVLPAGRNKAPVLIEKSVEQ